MFFASVDLLRRFFFSYFNIIFSSVRSPDERKQLKLYLFIINQSNFLILPTSGLTARIYNPCLYLLYVDYLSYKESKLEVYVPKLNCLPLLPYIQSQPQSKYLD